MNPLDRLAYSAADAIDASVSHVPVPTWGVGATSAFVGLRRTLGYALAGATAAVLAVVALLVVGPAEEVTDITPSTIVTTSVPVPTTVPGTVPSTAPTPTPDGQVPVVPVPIPGNEERPVQADTVAPTLWIVSPRDGVHVDVARIKIEGLAEVGASVATADGAGIRTDHEGRWSHTVELKIGDNQFVFVAMDAAGNTSEVSVLIVRDAPVTTTTKPRPKDTTTTTKARTWEFTAHNTYGTCAEDPPYDVFYGKGEPDTVVTVTSEHGGGSVEVGPEGSWELRVYFPEAPIGEQFIVKVMDHTGAKKHFEFTYLP